MLGGVKPDPHRLGPRYKKGNIDDRRRSMLEVIGALEAWDAPPALTRALRHRTMEARGPELKGPGDLVDASLCAMCVYTHRINGGKGTRLVGEEGHGYVLLPAQRSEDEGRAGNGGRLPGSGKALRVRRGRG